MANFGNLQIGWAALPSLKSLQLRQTRRNSPHHSVLKLDRYELHLRLLHLR
jgi:hypothetical protein